MRKKITAEEVLAAVREKCLECSGRDRKEVDHCLIRSCPLYSFRNTAAIMEASTKKDKNQISMFDEVKSK